MKISGFTESELARFREYQRASYAVLEVVAASLREGETEKDVTRRIRKRFHEQDVHHYFHVPVALFGDRTAYPGDFGQLGALPTGRKLEPGMPVILDAAPVYHGYTVDTSYATSFGDNPRVRELIEALRPLRDLILLRVRERASFRAIAREVDDEIRKLGYENCHRKHIAFVLGHRVTQVPDTWLHRRRIWGLGVPQAAYFIGKTLGAQQFGGDGSPNWNHTRTSDHPPTPGLWAVEPHLGKGGVGAKFEEILVITESDAYWLDEGALPHHRVWQKKGSDEFPPREAGAQ
ncbi:MAG: M24 family metallopeptidase [Nevskiaceae bacterium]